MYENEREEQKPKLERAKNMGKGERETDIEEDSERISKTKQNWISVSIELHSIFTVSLTSCKAIAF